MADTWIQRHNPGVLFDKDTWEGVGQYAKEQFNNLKQTGNQLKKDYWDNAAGNKNFWNELANGPQRLSDRQQLNYDMGNAALNVPISAVANAIPAVYNTAAGIVNPLLSAAGKVGKMDVTAKGPQLPYMNNWYKGYDFFQGGTPGMAQTQAAAGSAAIPIAGGRGFGSFGDKLYRGAVKGAVNTVKGAPGAVNYAVTEGKAFSPAAWRRALVSDPDRMGLWRGELPSVAKYNMKRMYKNRGEMLDRAKDSALRLGSTVMQPVNDAADMATYIAALPRVVATSGDNLVPSLIKSKHVPMSLRHKLYRADRRAASILASDKLSGTDILADHAILGVHPSASTPMTRFKEMGINPDDYEFQGNFKGAPVGPKTVPIAHSGGNRTRIDPDFWDRMPVEVQRQYYMTPKIKNQLRGGNGEVVPVNQSYHLTDDVLNPVDPDQLYKGVAPENKARIAGPRESTDKLKTGQALFATPDPGLAAAYDNNVAAISPKVAVKGPDGRPYISEHTGRTIDPAEFVKYPEMYEAPRTNRVPYNNSDHSMVFDPKATETLAFPEPGDTSYLHDLFVPGAQGTFSHYKRKGSPVKFRPQYMTETLPAAKGKLLFPGYNGGHTPTSARELRTLRLLNKYLGLGGHGY